jgi:ArsR family transcriptional regulator
MSAGPSILDSFSALADRTRCRMLWLLSEHELTVSELCAVLQLPQSTVSRQLKILGDADWVTSRRDGTSRYYRLSLPAGDESTAQLWDLTRTQLNGRAGVQQDGRRLARVLAQRSETSQRFFASSAGRWDRLRAELFGAEVSARALLGLVPGDWVVGDLGCGTGSLIAELAAHVATVVGVDGSDEMLAAARVRLEGLQNVDLRQGALEALPIATGALDAAVMMLVLHHLPSPGAALAEAKRALRPGGRLLVIDMAAHEHEEYRQNMGHVWLGFAEDQMRRLLEEAGFVGVRVHELPPVTAAKGPSLFAASAVSLRAVSRLDADITQPAADDDRPAA